MSASAKVPVSRHIPDGYVLSRTVEGLGVAYVDRVGTTVLAFSGRRTRPDFHERYSVADKVVRRLDGWEASIRAREVSARQRVEARRDAARDLAVDDVLRSTWGYEQTNVDYYQVTRLVGRTMVELRQISRISKNSGGYQGECVPAPGAFIGDVIRRRVDVDGVRIASGVHARKLAFELVEGVKIFKPDSWTAYY